MQKHTKKETKTQVRITEEAWNVLHKRKRLGDTLSDVIIRMGKEIPEEKKKTNGDNKNAK